MTNAISLDKNFSTTRLLTKEKPIIENGPEDKFESILFLPKNNDRKDEGGLRTKGYFKSSYDAKPLISIITVVYNGEKYLEETIQSVINQTYDNVEYIIIDGGSTDGTFDIITQHEDEIDYWVSEADGGIYDAMNKGISLSSGDYIAFLNADDWYNEDTIKNMSNLIQEELSDFVFADVDIYDEEDKFSHTFKSRIKKYRILMPFGHPALFTKRNILLSMPFDLMYPTASDYDFICKIIKCGSSFSFIDKSIVNFREGGVSTSTNTEKELFAIQNKHFGLMWASYSYIRFTKQPFILNIVKFLLNIKNFIKEQK